MSPPWPKTNIMLLTINL